MTAPRRQRRVLVQPLLCNTLGHGVGLSPGFVDWSPQACWLQEDASLANPFGPVAIGWKKIAEAMERAASNYADGKATSFEGLAKYVTPNLAYIVEVERFKARVGGKEGFASGALRVTSILRREDGTWKIVHRHADPITTPRPAESVIQN
jgi:ketosteroid isomerase-like protein